MNISFSNIKKKYSQTIKIIYKNNNTNNGMIIPAKVNFQPLFLKLNLPAGIMIAPVIAIVINEIPKISP
jgi:hypothetical protein